MSQAMFDHMMGSLAVGFHEQPLDLYSVYRTEWEFDTRCTTMPPSPGVSYYDMRNIVDEASYLVDYELNVKWERWISDLIQRIEPWQVTHRSREVAVACGAQRINELNHRISQVVQHIKDYRTLSLSSAQANAAYDIILDRTLHHMNVNYDWIHTYVKEHEDSSTGHGMKWYLAHNLDKAQWAELLERVLDNIERMQHVPGQWNDIKFYSGMRARSNPISSFRDHYVNHTDRTRIIMFYLALSIWTLFIPNKVAWYRDIMSEYMKMLGMDSSIHIPYLEGGQVYAFAADQFVNRRRFAAYDGKAWDSGIGVILGPQFRPFLANFQGVGVLPDLPNGVDMLPSGITVTSLLDTMAMVASIRHSTGEFLILGDDLNTWSAKGIPKVFPLEHQQADTKYEYILGVSYKVDPLAPRLSGLRVSMDRAGKMQPAPNDYSWHRHTEARSREIRALWAMMFLGKFGEHTLYEAITKIPAGKWISGELLETVLTEEDIVAKPSGKEIHDVITSESIPVYG